MKKVLLITLAIIAFSGCSKEPSVEKPKPENTVISFLSIPLSESSGVETYVENVDPYLDDSALISVKEKLETGESSYFKCKDIEIEDVKEISDSQAEVRVSYTMTVLGESGAKDYDKTVTFILNNTGDKWEIAE